MKKLVELVAIIAALVWAAGSATATQKPDAEAMIRTEFEGWEIDQLEHNDNTWDLRVSYTDGDRTIDVEGTVKVEEDEVHPVTLAVYGIEDGEQTLLATWTEGDDDWNYTDAAVEYFGEIEVTHAAY